MVPDEVKGATPTEYVIADSTPPPPATTPAPQDGVGAAPIAVLPGPANSDPELSADAVELLPASAEGTAAESSPTRYRQPPPEPRLEPPPIVPCPQPPAVSEPREVEPEAVEMVDSAEHDTPPTPPPLTERSRQLTPPPVRIETAAADSAAVPSTDRQRRLTPPPIRVEVPAPTTLPRGSDAVALTPPPVPAEPASSRPPVPTRPQGNVLPTASATATTEDVPQTPGASGAPVPEALARRSLQKRSKPWFEEVFDEDYLRTLPFMTAEQTSHEADFIRDVLAPPTGGDVLDIACGYGRHALELAQHGFHLTGLDLSLPLLIRAADDAQRRGLAVNFVHADMREMSFNGQFDAAYCVLSSFGYFDEDTNLRVASAICRSLKPGGRFLLDILNRDYIVGDLPSRVWWEGDGCVVLEEVDFNYHTSRVLVRRSVVFGNGRQAEQEISLRAYSLHEVGKLLRQAGLRVLQVSGSMAARSRFFGAASRNIIAVCERPTG